MTSKHKTRGNYTITFTGKPIHISRLRRLLMRIPPIGRFFRITIMIESSGPVTSTWDTR